MCNPRSQSFSSFSSVLAWIGENDKKTEMKTDTFENALVWMGPNNIYYSPPSNVLDLVCESFASLSEKRRFIKVDNPLVCYRGNASNP